MLNPVVGDGLVYLRKLNMQLASKMRFVSAQMLALFEGELYLRSAGHANAMATRLRTALEDAKAAGAITGLSFSQPTHTDAVFAILANDAADRIREKVHFYDWDRTAGADQPQPIVRNTLSIWPAN